MVVIDSILMVPVSSLLRQSYIANLSIFGESYTHFQFRVGLKGEVFQIRYKIRLFLH